MQTCGGGAALPLVIVDYAHTPDALDKSLRAARLHATGQLWCVFGCGGERDAGKRPQMGQIADALADRLIITDDNPRSEDPAAIAAAVLSGVTRRAAALVIHDRSAAIAAALSQAHAGDVVLVAGKGHEDYQLVGAERRPFSDIQTVRQALDRRGAA
jgi:UDP-N-acetylmuramoyl-L-alanyl-D-glutamate--2,6-diaminopimelate ligase